jgi:ubiquinone/menaquinone biosynthesis C-methylase UbiE
LDPAELRERNRATWSAGDWSEVAKLIQPVSDALVEALEIGKRMRVLDVATGNGNAAIRAAEQGAKVTGSDITDERIDSARKRAKSAGVEIEWVEADAEELPFDDDSFDRVISVFGVMFAPRHQRAADELVRVLKPGGVLGLANWTPEGVNGQMFKIAGAYAPPPPDYASPPPMWGTEKHIRKLFSGTGMELELERKLAEFDVELDSGEEYLTLMEENFGPLVTAKGRLSDQEWQEMKAELLDLFSTANKLGDEGFEFDAEYLRTIGRLPA